MKKNNLEINLFFNISLIFLYIIFSFLLFLYSPKTIEQLPIFYMQFFSCIIFVIFFIYGYKFNPKAFLLIGFIYNIVLSVFWEEYFINHQYLLDNNLDWKVYVKWAELSQVTNTFDEYLLKLFKTAYEFSDYGYPVFLYPFYKVFDSFENQFFSSCIGKSLFFTIGSLYVYKLSKYYTNDNNSKLIFLLWILNPVSVFFNGCNLKESVFVNICIFAFYNLTVYLKSHNKLYILASIFFIFLTAFFRIYVTLFFVATMIACTTFKKIVYNHFLLMWILVFLCSIIGIIVALDYIPALNYFLSQSIGGESGYSMPILILTAFLSPIPALNQTGRTPDNLLVCCYSIFSIFLSFYAIYEIYLIFKNKKKCYYPLLILVFFNKLMVIVTARSNEYRFQYPLVFTYFILMIQGFSDICTDGVVLFKKYRLNQRLIYLIILFLSIFVSILYN